MSDDHLDGFESTWLTMNSKQKAGCVIWPSLASGSLSDLEESIFDEYAPLGVTLFGRNLRSKEQGTALCQDLRQRFRTARGSAFPSMMIAIDEEGGRVTRLPPPFAKSRPAAELSVAGLEAIRTQASAQACFAKEMGINVFFAPVCDLLTEPTNSVIGDRAFGDNPETVIPCVQEVMDVLVENGICPVIKHFPGHGGTKEDTHLRAAHVPTPLNLLRNREWEVFRRCFNSQKGAPAVMTCHVIVEELDSHWPATLSSELIGKVLRDELGFDGVIFSDDMRMNAIAEVFGKSKVQSVAAASDTLSKLEAAHRALDKRDQADEYLSLAAIRALEVGIDVVLCCRGIEREESVLAAVGQRIESNPHFEQIVKKHARRAWKLATQWSV